MDSERMTQTVLITGATDGLGKAAALLLAQRGYRVFAAGRSPEKRAQLDAMAREKKLPLAGIRLDLYDGKAVEEAGRGGHGKPPGLQWVVNNARGTYNPGRYGS